MAPKIGVEAAAFEDRTSRADDKYEDVELSPEVLSLVEGKEAKPSGVMSDDPDIKAILDKFGGDPVKMAEATKAANRKMTEATEERNRLLDMYDGTNRRLNELENMMRSSDNPNQKQGREYYYQPPFQSFDEWDPAGNPEHVRWMAHEAARKEVQEEIKRFKQENTAKTQAQSLLERDDKFVAEHPELSDADISYLRRESQRRGVRELPDVYALIYGSSGSKEGGGGGRNKSEADLLSLLVSRVGNNLNKPQGLRGTGGGGGGSGKTRITLEDLQNMTPEEYGRLPEDIRDRIRQALPAFSKGY